MLERKLIIIAIQEEYLATITNQVKEVLGDKITIHCVTVKDLQKNTVDHGDVVVISNNRIKGLVERFIPHDCTCIVAKRDINYTNTHKLLKLPPGKKILVVNDNTLNARETVESLREIIFEHEYIAYTPEVSLPEKIDYIVTPGEKHLLPNGLTNVIDIGPRLLDISTFGEIIDLLQLNFSKAHVSKRYFKSCVSLAGYEQYSMHGGKDIRNIAQYSFEDIISVSSSMKEAIRCAKVYARDISVKYIYIEGKPGTGKSMFAQAIHNESIFRDQPFISIDCSSIDFNVAEKVLFGSMTEGSISFGLFEIAKNGTLCIEKIDCLHPSVKERILHSLKNGYFVRSTDGGEIKVDCRVIFTSSVSCEDLFKSEDLNDDFYHLISDYDLHIPSLSERMDDLPYLINNIKQRIKKVDIEIADEVLAFFRSYNWKGNVRELYNLITYMVSLNGNYIDSAYLPIFLRSNVGQENFNLFATADEIQSVIDKIEMHGYLDESIAILRSFYGDKQQRVSFGRKVLKGKLEKMGLALSEQQLRMRLEILQELGLIMVRQGRAGSTISLDGEKFLEGYSKMTSTDSKISIK
ncbi:AAA family ATPase [Virgibacillus dakarensis]|uniref:Sigma-54 factor interaction domain-containing protein n=1 Tax=Lentibacillus populi TaxID=1827502 RepID=A0A9W5X432_9BACI|nr:sigma 54-interacting transcriptional regulator [Lentibacillus populi]MTW87191.1 AAA family ATPase [Virgibacillus dakarensis]GGB31995.1 hypothetical protein GCM10011409_06730 [Lentibacillus populi]